MNVFEKVQEIRPEIDGAEENISAARSLLLNEIHAEKRPARSRVARRPWIITAGLVGAAAAVTVGVLVVGNVMTPTTGGVEAIPTVVPKPSAEPISEPTAEPTPEPTAEPLTAAGAFNAAGASASTFAGLTVAPGQYLCVHTDSQQMVYQHPDTGLGEFQTDRSTAANAWMDAVSWDNCIPADTSSDWYSMGGQVATMQEFGPDAAVLAEQHVQEIGAPSGPNLFTGGMPPWETAGGFSMHSFWQEMPRDPAQLIAWIRQNQGPVTGDQDYKVGWVLVDLLAENVGAPDVRSAMYGALSMLGGSEIVETQGDFVTLSFSATEQALSGADGIRRRTVTIDMSSGLVLEKTVTLDVASPLVPASLVDERYTYTVSVVDSLP